MRLSLFDKVTAYHLKNGVFWGVMPCSSRHRLENLKILHSIPFMFNLLENENNHAVNII
jgi:hypothetical protein